MRWAIGSSVAGGVENVAGVAQIQSLAQKLPYAVVWSKRKKKRERERFGAQTPKLKILSNTIFKIQLKGGFCFLCCFILSSLMILMISI